jgi:hypothetical protein
MSPEAIVAPTATMTLRRSACRPPARRTCLLLDETLPPGDRLAGCLVVLYGQQPSKISALRTADTCCAAGATRLKLGAGWLDVPEPVATLCGNTYATAPT